MSILPPHTPGHTSSSSQSLSPNPNNFNHGSSSPNSSNNHNLLQQPPLSLSPPSPFTRFPGALAPASESFDRGGSSQKVSKVGNTDGQKLRSPQSRGRFSGGSPSSSTGNGSADPHGGNTQLGGRRGQVTSGNHLLNFQYEPISRPLPRPPPPPRRQHKTRPYNKDLFLQANYKFVILDSPDYVPEQMDPDKMLQWEDIICLRYSTPSLVQCPICLEEPLCPQITSCGHIFCFPCVLRYLLMGEDNHKGDCFKRCPLCFVMISQKDLYTVYIEKLKQYSVGDSIEFLLLTRKKDSFTLSRKHEHADDAASWSNDNIENPFRKLTFTTDVDLSVREAIADLDGWLAKADSGLVDDLDKLPYVCAALEELEKRKKNWNEQRVSKSRFSKSTDIPSETQTSQDASNRTKSVNVLGGSKNGIPLIDRDNQKNSLIKPRLYSIDTVSSLDHGLDLAESIEEKELDLSSSHDENQCVEGHLDYRDTKGKDFYNFYQAADGQNLVLHPLNMKCLLHHYGSYEMLPSRISGKILQMETVTQSEAVRRRYRYLSHFSLTTTFQLCEIDLSEMLPTSALLPFMDEIKKREKQRKQLARQERKEKIKAEAANQVFVPIRYDQGQSSHVGSPTYSMDDFEALGTPPTLATSPPVVGQRNTFLNVTRLGFAAAHDSPALKAVEDDSQPQHGTLRSSPGPRSASTPSFASMISRAKSVESLEAPKPNEMVKKGRKQTQLLLSTSGGRRY